ncbi:hypothetical protein AB4876_14245 [Zhongshania guokunii]|uniref:Lipoprotein n=1 Tax=Zhongshania guokunii TaxID=641783 RepID=A0ABV3UAE0_9GAMM
MKSILPLIFSALFLFACASNETVVYSNGFSFGNYDYVVIERDTNSAIYGMDLEFGNMIGAYNMAVVGSKEIENLPYTAKKRTLGVQLSVSGSDERIMLGISFQDFITGRTVATIGSTEKGDLFDRDDRKDIFELVSNTVVAAIKRDKQLNVQNGRSLERSRAVPIAESVNSNEYDEYESAAEKPYSLTPDFSE